jgi:glycosyltransferase involved in cell wall biosynthesis
VLVGGRHELEPSCADALADQARLLGRDRQVLLVGQQTNPEEWMQAMDVFVHTSRNEPFGMVVIEAMSLGKAVIASAEGGPTEIITPGVDGVLCPYGDVRVLAAAIVSLLDDDDFRNSVGDAARRRAGDFTVGRFAHQFGGAIAGVVGDSRHPGVRSAKESLADESTLVSTPRLQAQANADRPDSGPSPW